MSVLKGKKKTIIIGTLTVLILGSIILGLLLFQNKLYSSITIEAGTEDIHVSDFIKDGKGEGVFITNLNTIDFNLPGTYPVEIQVGKRVYTSDLTIEDTVAPTAEVINHLIWAGKQMNPEEFVENIVDATQVTVSFGETPDFNKIGKQDVVLILEDSSGNTSELVAHLTVEEDNEPPMIHGAHDLTVFIGDTVGYRRGITVLDNMDENVDLQVDSSEVNLRREGTYNVVYTATDGAGNTTTQTVLVYVKERTDQTITQHELDELADQVLEEIINEEMSELEKAWEIFKWTRNQVTNVGSSDKSNWMNEAAQGIQRGTGDCFTFYATSRILLTRAGIQNIPIERDSTESRHYWNLVKIDSGWYHFDSMPNSTQFYYIAFMRTDEEVEEYTILRQNEYFKFDKTKYPSTPTQPLDFDRNY